VQLEKEGAKLGGLLGEFSIFSEARIPLNFKTNYTLN